MEVPIVPSKMRLCRPHGRIMDDIFMDLFVKMKSLVNTYPVKAGKCPPYLACADYTA